jgi:large subunit ribosomal protein L28
VLHADPLKGYAFPGFRVKRGGGAGFASRAVLWYKIGSNGDERDTIMPKVCEICEKGPVFGHSVSHSHKASPKKWKPNLQRVKAQTPKGIRQIWVCSRCLRSGKVAKAA